MYVAHLTITPKTTTDKAVEEVYDAAKAYCGNLKRHGQIYGEEIIAWVGKRLQITFLLAGPDAHRAKNHSTGGRSELRVICRLCKTAPKWTMIGNAVKRHHPVPDWRKESALYLFTHVLDETSPVCAGSTGEPVPTYLLPLDDCEIEWINGWASCYRAHDKIWLNSGALEIPAYIQTADSDSELCEQGREICRKIEQSTGKPTYYYLHRYHGRRDRARERNCKCPGCGQSWARQVEAPPYKGILGFEFRCDGCRLISNVGPDDWDERYAHIGEWKPKKRRSGSTPTSA